MHITGKNNVIKIIKDGEERPELISELDGLQISINGNNNVIIIELPSNFQNSNIIMKGDCNHCHIKASKHRFVRKTIFWLENGGIIHFGSKISVIGKLEIISKKGKTIDIGDNCMFSKNITIRNNDGHTILDKDTNEVINDPKDIKIGNNVWVGAGCTFLKGAEVSDGSVVGAMSLVNKTFTESNVIIAGVPAKIIRKNIIWQR